MNFIDEKIENYAIINSSPNNKILEDLERNTLLKVLNPRMLSGYIQGRFLSFLSKMIKPENILEIGTFTGYSALCLAEGLKENGKLITIEKNPELEPMATGYFEKAGLIGTISMEIGDAATIIPLLTTNFDLVFIDADKENYSLYYDLVKAKMNKGGWIIADNVLWSGKVIDEKVQDVDTMALRAFSRKVMEDPTVENLMLPLRDGLMLIRLL